MSLIDEMRNLRESIENGKEIRSRRIKEIKENLSVFMKGAGRKRKEDFKALTEEVNKFITDLKKDVEVARRENRLKGQEFRKELSAALGAFWRKKMPVRKQLSKEGEL